jgi:hypothetical protein
VVAQHTGRDQVCELFAPNSGRDPVPNVIKRTRLPRNFQGLRRDFAATSAASTHAATLAGLPDLGATKDNCYNLLDLIVGAHSIRSLSLMQPLALR